jgi:hypothetical protein
MFGIAAIAFNVAANFVTPMLMAIVATSGSSQLVVTGIAVQMLGLAVGPALAASVIQPGQFGNAVALGIIAFLVCLATGLHGKRLLGGTPEGGVSARAAGSREFSNSG